MTPHRDESPLKSFPWRSALAAALAVSLLVGLPAFTDDTNLLRFDTAKPYVFIILDTSASMGMAFEDKDDVWTPGGADGPGSRLYQAKQALFNTFSEVNDVHFGFASFNQDEVRAYQKHWIYYHENDIQADNAWPIPFPLPDGDSTIDPDATDDTADDGDSSALTKLVAITTEAADGTTITGDRDTRELEIEGHLLTFGRAFDLDANDLGVDRNAGTCDGSNGNPGPLNFNDDADLRKLQSFAINGDSAPPTQMWLTDGMNNNYLLEVWKATTEVKGIGEDNIQVELRLSSYSTCTSASQAADGGVIAEETLQMRLDPYLGETFFIDSTQGTISDGTNNQGIETLPKMWEHQDAVSDASFGDRPFTGKGWESNYDSGGTVADNDPLQTALNSSQADRWCAAGTLSADGTCPRDLFLSEVKPVEDTIFDNQDRRSLDIGDMIPFHWSDSLSRRADFLDRLAPGYSSAAEPDFRGASFFADRAGALSDVDKETFGNPNLPLQLKNSSNRPLLALDNSPLARAINDMRCWYLGNRGQGSNKCDSENPVVDTGWEEAACEFDSQFGCRKPYLIIISDGEDNVAGENASADVGDLQGASGVRTWVLNLGDPKNCTSGELNSIVNAGGTGKGSTGECIDVAGGGDLRQELESILGEIRTEVRAFASAAVPTVQATVEQKIFLTNFTPFNDSGVWDGHIDSFLKPLPVDEGTGKPDESKKCGDTYVDEAGETRVRVTRCFLWDAGDNLFNLQYDDTLVTDDLVDETDRDRRRVFYAQQSQPGEWAKEANRHLLEQTDVMYGGDGSLTVDPVHLDLWEAFGIDTSFTTAAEYESKHGRADEIIDFVLRKKSGTELNSATGTQTVIDFLLGDIFHSTPQVVGTPPNLFYFARDLNGEDGGDCLASADGNENKGYRCFFNRHRLRRKMLLVGSNDGQLHAFDAGRFRGHDDSGAIDSFTELPLVNEANPFGSFDNGTGLELFSYVPRMVMPTLNAQETTPSEHFFTVDGNFTVADVFIDPVADTATFPADADREWRTVVVGGLREGGAGYYALDITQPDVIEDHDDLGFVPKVPSGATNDPASADYIPGCLSGSNTNCGDALFPAVVWEFTDRVYDTDTSTWYYVDEDKDWMTASDSPHSGAVGSTDPSFEKADLGDSWSTPNIGRIQVCTGADCAPGGADVEDRYVAVFGGGMDVESKSDPTNEVRGNWLYMVDVETGQAIYKQRLTGAAPAEPASVDLNGDGYFDRIYIGTLAGLLYRVDIGLVDGSVPALTPVDVTGINHPDNPSATITAEVDRIPRDVWVPKVLFNTNFDIGFNDDGTPITDDSGALADQDADNFRPIYYRPAVIFQADDEGFVLAFGTGDREDLWSLEPVTGRFFTLVDSFASTDDISAPLNESDLARVGVGDASNAGQNFLETGGWYLVLNEKERVITEAFSLSGLTIFSAYEPIVFTGEDATAGEDSTTETEQVCGEDIAAVDADTVCSLRGNSNIYVVNTTNADGLLFDAAGAAQRSKQVADFVTNPFTEQGTVKRAEGDGSDAEGDDGGSADQLTPDLEKVMDSLKSLFPDQCRFANYRVDVKTIAADTSLQFIAPIPVCIIEHNWKEY